jgi:hypothetical protein
MTINTPQAIIGEFPMKIFAVKTNRMFDLPEILKNLPETESVYRFGDVVHYLGKQEQFNNDHIVNYLKSAGHDEISVSQIQPTIEDSFMFLMGHEDPKFATV